ncbi:MAG: tetratricopeptide repeat protein, partial [Desulfovibrio sp.]|nr:tetratricopeptide repeat protein [Desulfovibrio sp.]
WTELGNLYFDARAFEDAINAYEKSLSIDPRNPDALTDLGIMYRETEQFQKAIESFRKASALDPTHQNSLYNEGIVFAADLHNVEEATKAWEKLLKINPHARSPEGALVADKIQQLRR